MAQFYGNEQIQHTLHQMLFAGQGSPRIPSLRGNRSGEKDAGKAVPGRTALHRNGKALRQLQILQNAGGRCASGRAVCGTQRQAKRLFRGHGAGGV